MFRRSTLAVERRALVLPLSEKAFNDVFTDTRREDAAFVKFRCRR